MGWPRRVGAAVTDGVSEIREQKRLFFGLLLLAALLLFTYGLARPPVKSLFTELYGADKLPWVWLAVAVCAVVAAGIYGRFAAAVRAPRLFWAATSIIAALFVLVRIGIELQVPHAHFALYVLMETYIVVLVESFWSLANLSFDLKSARLVYGLFCAAGSTGAGAAEYFQADLAAAIGTENILWLIAPVLVAAGWLCTVVVGDGGVALAKTAKKVGYREGWRVVTSSRYLLILLLIVACSQILINVVDYHLTDVLDTMYPGEALRDQRTGVFGEVYFAINVAALTLQALTGPILGALGVTLVLVAIPSLVTTAVTVAWTVPRIATGAVAFVSSKTLDYSLFRASKELLYLPLAYREKTVGKAFVDMNTYRAAKAGASILLLALIPVGKSAILAVAVAVGLLWLVLTLLLAPRYVAALKGQSDRAGP